MSRDRPALPTASTEELAGRVSEFEALPPQGFTLSDVTEAQQDRLAENFRILERIARFGRGQDPGAPVSWGGWEIEAPVGRGTMAEGYRVRDASGATRFLRLLHPRREQPGWRWPDLLGQAPALASLQHPCLARVHAIEAHEGRQGIVMDWLEGDSLAMRLEGSGSLQGEALHRLAHDLAAALAVLHAAGLEHRELRPSSCFARGDGGWVFADGGGAHLPLGPGFADDPVASRWFAPELARGASPGPRSDLWSWSATVAAAAGHAGSGTPRTGPPALDELLEACIEDEPGRRPADARALLAALEGGTR